MKLLTHTGLFWITMSMILFFMYGVAFYFVFKELSSDRLEKELRSEMEMVLENPEQFTRIKNQAGVFFERYSVDTLEYVPEKSIIFYDSIVYNQSHQSYEPVRCIQFIVDSGELPVQFKIYKSTIPSDKLTERIVFLISLTALLFALGLYLLNRHIFTRTWKGFYTTLRNLKSYRPGNKIPEFEENEIDEFEDLNVELRRMIGRISSDYQNLQSFTSHTTHEFQTPLAVILSKAELLVQNDSLSEEQLAQVNSIIVYARQLSKVTQALSLLFKIENEQFKNTNRLDLKDVIIKSETALREECLNKNVVLRTSLNGSLEVNINEDLAGIMVGNLLRNSIIHNHDGGKLEILLNDHELRISNTGPAEALDEKSIFHEFYKGDQSGGLGLGLAIARKIADQGHLKLSYSFQKDCHIFSLIRKKID